MQHRICVMPIPMHRHNYTYVVQTMALEMAHNLRQLNSRSPQTQTKYILALQLYCHEASVPPTHPNAHTNRSAQPQRFSQTLMQSGMVVCETR